VKRYLNILLMIVLMLSMGSLFADTYTEDFDTDSYWSGGSMTGYNAKTYTNASAPGGLTFSSNSAFRGVAPQDVLHSGVHAWRIAETSRDPVGEKHLLAEMDLTLNGFSVYMARWDNSPKPNVDIEYSTDGGTTFTLIEAITGDIFSGDKVYLQYTHTFATPIEPNAGSTIQIRFNTTAGERMLYDDFTIDYGEGGPTPIELAADFSADLVTGVAPLTVNFTSTVMGGTTPYYYSWDFDNNGTEDSDLANPSHTYTEPGTYSVSLYVLDEEVNESEEVKLAYITVLEDSGEATELMTNGGFELWTDATHPTGWSVVQNVNQEATTVHGGSYSVKHTAAGTKKFSQDVTGIIGGQSYTISYWYLDNDTVARSRSWSFWLNGTTTIADNEAELRPATYSEDNASWQHVTHTLVAPATANGFRFEVRTYGASGDNYFDDFSVIGTSGGGPTPDPLVVNFTANVTAGEAPLTVNFTNLVSGGEAPYLYSWDFNGDNTEDSAAANPSFTYNAPGTYPVKLYVLDSGLREGTEYKAGYITVTAPGELTYYTGITATEGAALRTQLKNLVSTNTSTSYDGARAVMYSNLDNINGTVTCVYTGKLENHAYGNTSAPSGMNCEHTYPQSWIEDYDSQGEVGRAKADVNHLFPTLSGVNSSRGNLSFDDVASTATAQAWSEAPGYTSYRGSNSDGVTVFQVADQHKGNVARSFFYMNLRYNLPLDKPTPNSGAINVDMLATLLEWHNDDPVDANEIIRNNKVQDYQTNRNPFIDHPEWVSTIYGGTPVYTCVQPTISPAGGTFATAQIVTLASATDGATIHYTTNGTTPTIASTTYTDPFTLYDDATVKAIATKVGFEDSAVTSANFVIDIAGDVPVGMIISEYAEAGSGNSKYVEIYNGTGADVDLTPYNVRSASNGGPWNNTYDMTGTLGAGDVFVIANSGSVQAILDQANAFSSITYFNGDDAVSLFYNDIEIDVIGVQGTDPGTGWDVAGVTNGTVDHVLVRKNSVTQGNTDWATSAGTTPEDSEWIVYPDGTYDYLGYHGVNVVAAPVILPLSGTYTDEVEITITCATTGATIYYTVDGTDPTTASTPYAAPFTLTADATVKAFAVKADYTNSAVISADYVIISGGNIPVGMIISEYIEGNVGNNKAIEIYNGTGAEVDLTPYNVRLASNGNAWGATCNLEGTLAAGDVFVIAHAESYPEILAVTDLTDPVANFNGDDAIGLFYNEVLIDVIGIELERPSTGGWDVAGIAKATKDQTLVRKMTVLSGTTNWALSAGTNADDSQWVVYPAQTFNMLGSHTAPLDVVNAPVFTPVAGDYTAEVLVTIATTTPGAAIYYTLDNSTPTNASTLYSAPFTLAETKTVKAIAMKDGFVASAMTTAEYTITIPVVYEDGITVSETALEFVTEFGVECPVQSYILYMQAVDMAIVEVTGDFEIKNPENGVWTGDFFFELNDEEVVVEVRFKGTNLGTANGQIIHTTDDYEEVIIELTGTTFQVAPTSIYDIQYTTIPGVDGTYPSLLNGQTVLVEGVVTFTGYKGSNFFISSPQGGAWNSIYVYNFDNSPTVGDMVSFKAVVDEYFGWTELKNLSQYAVISQGNPVPAPIVLTTAQLASDEAYESSLVTIQGVTVTAAPDIKNQWYVTDGSGAAQVDDEIFRLLPDPVIGDTFASITGIMDYSYDEYSINPRSIDDFVMGGGTDLDAPVITSISKTPAGIVITWNPVTGANSYNIYGCDSPDGEFTYINSVGTTSYINNGTDQMKFFKIEASTDGGPAK